MIFDKIFSKIDEITKRKDGKKDYCSASPDVWFGVDISHACEDHDFHYEYHDVSKLDADKELRENIIKAGNGKFIFKIIAFFYYWGVRIFGSIYSW